MWLSGLSFLSFRNFVFGWWLAIPILALALFPSQTKPNPKTPPLIPLDLLLVPSFELVLLNNLPPALLASPAPINVLYSLSVFPLGGGFVGRDQGQGGSAYGGGWWKGLVKWWICFWSQLYRCWQRTPWIFSLCRRRYLWNATVWYCWQTSPLSNILSAFSWKSWC